MKRLLMKAKSSVAAMTLVALMLIGTGVKASAACQLWYIERDVVSGEYYTCFLVREVKGPISVCGYYCPR